MASSCVLSRTLVPTMALRSSATASRTDGGQAGALAAALRSRILRHPRPLPRAAGPGTGAPGPLPARFHGLRAGVLRAAANPGPGLLPCHRGRCIVAACAPALGHAHRGNRCIIRPHRSAHPPGTAAAGNRCHRRQPRPADDRHQHGLQRYRHHRSAGW
ncbi:hypothetical protein G6F59_014514 [Rhizopus arrhizus]|nr:hypothetical protein G6F59_014514 [Rhizopus arrhizus]